VLESEQKLRHLPFFEEVASHEEGDAAWRSATAGLVVLRLVDAWLENGRSVVADDGWSVRSVRAAIESIDEGTPIRSILDRVVDALHEQKPDIHVVVTPLMAYGRSLEYEAKWRLAVDVYHSILSHLHPVADADASIAAHMRLGYCYRSLLMIDDATEAFATASQIAAVNGDVVGVLLARVNEGHIAVLRGNLPQAEQILDDAIGKAQGPALQDVRARALHERSTVAYHRGDFDLAVRLGYDAFNESLNSVERDRILSDLALSFTELGVYSAARDAYLVLSATAQEQYMRWAATINLIEVSSYTRSEVHFELYRRELANVSLPPLLATAYHYEVGLAYQRFGNSGSARSFLERSLAMASEFGLNQYVFGAEAAIDKLETHSPLQRTPAEVSLDVREVAGAIRELRETAGV
jgi:tetratricopeptide (TPR) repeat protein